MSLPEVQNSTFFPVSYAKIPSFQSSFQQKIPSFTPCKKIHVLSYLNPSNLVFQNLAQASLLP